MRSARISLALLCLIAAASPAAYAEALSEQNRINILREIDSEYCNAKETFPRSKKPLEMDAEGGRYDQAEWASLIRQNGPAARLGDQVQITKVVFEKTRIIFEINGGVKSGKHWYDHVEMGTGNKTTPIGRGDATGTNGTSIALTFHKPLEDMDAAAVKKLLSPVLDFNKATVTQLYADTLTPEVKKAIAEKRAESGMDREQVILAMGRPDRKIRETKDGDELEDWIYGHPPGKVVFVTFNGDKVLKIKETYAGLGAEAAAPLPANSH